MTTRVESSTVTVGTAMVTYRSNSSFAFNLGLGCQCKIAIRLRNFLRMLLGSAHRVQ